MTSTKNQDDAWNKVRRLIQLIVVIAMVVFAVIYLYQVFVFGGMLSSVLMEHIPAAIGLPLACLAASSIVAIFELQQPEGASLKLKGFGFDFDGASGPIVLWIFCFLAIVSAIKLLW